MPPKRRTVEPLGWTRPRGYANGVLAEGRFLFVAGQIGWDPRENPPRFAQGFAAQFDQALKNVADQNVPLHGRQVFCDNNQGDPSR